MKKKIQKSISPNMVEKLTLVNSQITDERCEYCNREIKKSVVNIQGIIMNFKTPCVCRKEEYAKREKEMEKIKKQRKYERLICQSRLGERLLKVNFEDFVVNEDSKEIYNKIKNYAYNFKDYKQNSILMYGPPGTGKTILAASVAKHLMDNGFSAVLTVVPDLLMQIRKSFSDPSITEAQIMDCLLNCDLLLIDDLGVENHNKKESWAREKIYQIVNSRYNNLKATIFTTNCNPAELCSKVGTRTFSRICEMTTGFKLCFDKLSDWRIENFR